MKNAFIQLKNGYNTAFPCEFMTEEDGLLRLWSEKGIVGIFLLSQVEMCVITEKRTGTE
jgi:hypothetical protein